MVMQTQHLVLGTIVGMWRFAALALEGARLSERQMAVSSMSLMLAFFGFIGARPVRRPSGVTPPQSLFEPAVLISTLLQAVVHICVLRYAVSMATTAMGPAKLAELIEFQRWAKAQPFDFQAARKGQFLSTPFMPNLLNSVVFYVEIAQAVALLLVNYKGRPWMRSVTENLPLLSSSALALGLVFACASGASPALLQALQLTPLPQELAPTVGGLLAATLLGTYALDRAVEAALSSARARARWQAPVQLAEGRPVLPSAARLVSKAAVACGWLAFVSMVLSGNPLWWIVAYQWWTLMRRRPEAQPGS